MDETRNNQRPPFSPEQIVTMVLVIGAEPTTEEQIVDWIVKTFSYYGDVFHKKGLPGFDNYDVLGLYSTMRSLEIPAVQMADTVWQVCATEARLFLRNAVGPATTNPFPFLQLPPELRHIIYNLVFAYPRAGIGFMPFMDKCPYNFQTTTRDTSLPFSSVEDSRPGT